MKLAEQLKRRAEAAVSLGLLLAAVVAMMVGAQVELLMNRRAVT